MSTPAERKDRVRLNEHLKHDCGLTVFEHAGKMGLGGDCLEAAGLALQVWAAHPIGSSSRTRRLLPLSGRRRIGSASAWSDWLNTASEFRNRTDIHFRMRLIQRENAVMCDPVHTRCVFETV